MKKFVTLLGYINGKNAMQTARITKNINPKTGMIRWTDNADKTHVTNYTTYLLNMVFCSGWKPEIKEIKISAKGEYFKTPRKEYWITKEIDGSTRFNVINKSQYDFIMWALDHFKTIDDAAAAENKILNPEKKAKKPEKVKPVLDLSAIMILAWTIYHTFTSGSHREKLSNALKMAWAQYKNPEPAQPSEELDQYEVIEVKYPDGHMLFEMGILSGVCPQCGIGRRLFKMCKKSDNDYRTNTVERWAFGAKWSLYKAESDLSAAKSRRESEKVLKKYQREVDSFKKAVEILTA